MSTIKIIVLVVGLTIAFLGIISPVLFELYYQHLDRKYPQRPTE